jgi:glycerophosphoryl diester phosphodiesterase
MRLSPFGLIDRWLAPVPRPGMADWLGKWTYAHRGEHGSRVPENSLAAARLAIAHGHGIECDIQLSRDGVPMVFHDWNLQRLLRVEGETAACMASELSQMPYPGTDESPATLDDLLALIDGRVPLLIEIKSKRGYDVEQSCRAVLAALKGYHGQHAAMSFDPRVPAWFARHSPQTVRGLVVTEEGAKGLAGDLRRHFALWHARPQFLAYDIRDLPSRFAAGQRSRGMPVATWTVRSPELLARARLHADAPIAEAQGLVSAP